MKEGKIHRLWQPITFEDNWRLADTSVLDDLSSAWFARRARLRLDSKGYVDFLERLKREHAIETGVVERLYDINRGVTETLIQHGFVEGFLSHGDANIPSDQLMRHLNDHLEAMDFVFDLIKENRPLTTGFIKELHQLVTRNQHGAEGRDSQGNRTKIPLLKGTYKEWENNPTRSDGTVIMYCPPMQVASEMDQLVNIYHALEDEKVHPLIIAAWVHHAFTTIHPFQDGNGRVIRLVASLILIKHNLFPITVLREEAKLKYILALEKADAGMPSDLVSYFAVIQKRQIEKALNLGEVVSESLDEVKDILSTRLAESRNKINERKAFVQANRNWLYQFCHSIILLQKQSLVSALGDNASILLQGLNFDDSPGDIEFQRLDSRFYSKVMEISKLQEYHVNEALPTAWISIKVDLKDLDRSYLFVLFFHHVGVDDSAILVRNLFETSFRNSGISRSTSNVDNLVHMISILDQEMEAKEKNLRQYIESSLTIALAQIANDLG